jgi:DNA-binding Lrp family transcriptional regulator
VLGAGTIVTLGDVGVVGAADVVVAPAGLVDVIGVVGVLGPVWADPFVVDVQAVRPIVEMAIAATAIPRTWARMGRSCQAGRMVKGTTDALDELDARLLRELDAAPRVGVLELSRRLGVARATVQARLDRLVGRGVIATFAPTLDPEALGFQVTAFATLEIRQGRGAQVLDHLRQIPEVLEVHTITGQGDMLCRLVARSNDDLQHVLNRVTEFEQIVRTSTVIALSNPISHRVLPLVSP